MIIIEIIELETYNLEIYVNIFETIFKIANRVSCFILGIKYIYTCNLFENKIINVR